MKREDAATLAGLLREAAQQGLVPSLTYQGADPLSGFHGWADGKPNLAVVQLDREDAQYRLLVSDWRKTGEEFYLVIYKDVGT